MALSHAMLRELIATAQQVSTHAYSPYSCFQVGAAIMTEDRTIFAGCNVENASYSLTICAERSAIFQAVARGHTRIQALLIYTPTPKPVAPCGACRQVLYEFGPDAEVFSVCDSSDILKKKLTELLPEGFGPHDLP